MALLELTALEIAHRGTSLVDGVSFALEPGTITALVGESGSGKTLTARALAGVLPKGLESKWERLTVDSQSVATARDLAPLRGRVIAAMPQDATSALDPVMRIGQQVDEVSAHVAKVAQPERGARRDKLLAEVGFAEPATIARQFPHQLSGGMRQRALLAVTLAAEPKVLLADEPTTALDAHLRGAVLELLRDLVSRRRLALLFITHDLAAAEQLADQLVVLYAGRLCERGPAKEHFREPRHPYTRALQQARLDRPTPVPLRGALPSVGDRAVGCRFAPRCDRASTACGRQPPLVDGVACHHPGGR